ncbi:AbrB/MazE/SpoVT family DNA-binding domain-containing protein [Aquibium sp. ELW1220]|uniref:AbrB/MazE/SpoVT family DNA-binding domain-containing protein n=1 Tax=Aquibium sp. ELW1220 TaxID=2976766 RepID=UPI0025B0A55D|nr:AbrB/MazE/SpoVT family DNA-binding domain-containing protein [Aquibium sp. ELW1220]MDN2583634.1 AbrB/MazE/SpoVT family DNA-binding domain-containing protein [Aquibium sp. ELW1220]
MALMTLSERPENPRLPASLLEPQDMSATATISTEFQIAILKAVRDERGWLPGQKLALVPQDGGVMLVPVPELDDLLGILPDADPSGYRDRGDRY